MEKIGSLVVYEIREHFHRQRKALGLAEKAVIIDVVLFNETGQIIIRDKSDLNLFPLRLLDAYGTNIWNIDTDRPNLTTFLLEMISEHKDEAMGLTRTQKHEKMREMIEKRLNDLGVSR